MIQSQILCKKTSTFPIKVDQMQNLLGPGHQTLLSLHAAHKFAIDHYESLNVIKITTFVKLT